MAISIAHLGPAGTNAEVAASLYADWLAQDGQTATLHSCSSIAESLRMVAAETATLAVVPVENSIGGSVTVTLDTLWQLETLQIQAALVLPISHALLSRATAIDTIQTVYSHPQALAQCQVWLEQFLPKAQLVPTNSTTEALDYLDDLTIGAISSERAAQLYNLPILASAINDHPENCTRFWVIGLQPSPGGPHTSLAFSLQKNAPGALVKPLQIFADRTLNLSRIESRPTKRSLGDYLFFIDLEADAHDPSVELALAELKLCTETLKVFGSYDVLPMKLELMKLE